MTEQTINPYKHPLIAPISDNARTDLKAYYKRILTCTKCKLIFGSDLPTTSLLCPVCIFEDRSFKVKNTLEAKRKSNDLRRLMT